jgi:hypothetical protein
MRKTTLCVLGVLLFATVPARAGDLTVFGGFHHPGRVNLSSAGELPGTIVQLTDPKDFGVFGVRFNTSDAFIGFEHTLAYSPNFLDSDAFAIIPNSNLIIGVPALRIRPYGTAGVGVIVTGGDGPASFGTKFAFNYGGGVKISLIGSLGFRADVRGYMLPALQDQTLHVFETSAGLLIGF